MQIIDNSTTFKPTPQPHPSLREIALEFVEAVDSVEKQSKFQPGDLMREVVCALSDAIRDREVE